ncbi:hypothetical protein ACWEP3_19975, partial [Streptomyces albidoflavus]
FRRACRPRRRRRPRASPPAPARGWRRPACRDPEPDQVRLHLRCAAWWDLDTDGPAREIGPARTVKLTGRCWQAVDTAWVSHAR